MTTFNFRWPAAEKKGALHLAMHTPVEHCYTSYWLAQDRQLAISGLHSYKAYIYNKSLKKYLTKTAKPYAVASTRANALS
jgi:hypothetical protein